MNCENEKNFLLTTCEAIRNRDQEKLRLSFIENSIMCYKENSDFSYSDGFILSFCSLLRDTNTLDFCGAIDLLSFFETDWGTFTASQKKEIFGTLKTTFGLFKDWVCNFLITEILGEYYANEAAYEFLLEIGQDSINPNRNLAVHGLEHLALGTSMCLSDKSVETLLVWKTDTSSLMRLEVIEALERIQKKKGQAIEGVGGVRVNP